MRDIIRFGKRFWLPAGLATLIAIPVLAQTGPPGRRHGPPPGDGPRMERIFERLDLTDEQREQVRGVLDGHSEATAAEREELRTRREALMELVRAPEIDEAAIRAAAGEVAAIKTDLLVARAALHQELRQLLTPEQIEQLEELRERRRERMEERRGYGRFAPRGRRPVVSEGQDW